MSDEKTAINGLLQVCRRLTAAGLSREDINDLLACVIKARTSSPASTRAEALDKYSRNLRKVAEDAARMYAQRLCDADLGLSRERIIAETLAFVDEEIMPRLRKSVAQVQGLIALVDDRFAGNA